MSDETSKPGKFAWTRIETSGYNKGSRVPNGRGIALSAVAGFVALLVLGVGLSGLHTVGAGERAVIFHSDGTLGELGPGKFQFVLPVKNTVTLYDVRSQVDKATADAATSDLQTVTVEVTVQFHPDPTQISWIHQNIGGDYLGKVIQPAVQEAVKSSTATHGAKTIIQERPLVKDQIEAVLQSRLGQSHIILDQVSLTNIKFSDAYSAAVEKSQEANQNIILEQNNLLIAKLKANQTIEAARGQAEAAALLNQATQGSQGSAFLYMEWLKHWDGKLPTVMAGGDTSLLVTPPAQS